ncbi:hypothetical protein, partial [Stenotrophomonas sp. S48]|uniref:hypothetical protein n=1 Tax=Stenotrophomonas sp. S48 TaxID=2767465 RepID=UPI001F40720F
MADWKWPTGNDQLESADWKWSTGNGRLEMVGWVESTVSRLSRAARVFRQLWEEQSTNSRLYPVVA